MYRNRNAWSKISYKMRLNVLVRYMGIVMLFVALLMMVATIVSLVNDVDTAFYPLLMSFTLTAVLGAFPLFFVRSGGQITNQERYVIVVG